MTSTIPSPGRRALALGALGSAALALAGCGGGSSASQDKPADFYGGALTPGSVLLTVTNRVAMTVSYPDTTGVDWNTIDQAGYKALPLLTKTINIGLDANHAPLSTANFLAYVKSGAYVNTVFHRVSLQYSIIQGGGYTNTSGTLTAIATNAAIGLESRNGLANTPGTLAMARQTDPNTATSQFFFNVGNNASTFDFQSDASPGYAVFGSILDSDSMATLSALLNLQLQTTGGSSETPVRDFTVTAVTLS